jgi:hypothetical protein
LFSQRLSRENSIKRPKITRSSLICTENAAAKLLIGLIGVIKGQPAFLKFPSFSSIASEETYIEFRYGRKEENSTTFHLTLISLFFSSHARLQDTKRNTMDNENIVV